MRILHKLCARELLVFANTSALGAHLCRLFTCTVTDDIISHISDVIVDIPRFCRSPYMGFVYLLNDRFVCL